MATTISDDELFESAIRDVEEAAKPQPKKKPTASKSQTEKKREKFLELSKDDTVEKSASFIRKANKGIVEKLYNDYEEQRMSFAGDFLSTLIISKFASVLGSLNAVGSSEKLSEELLNDKLLKDDVAYLTRTIFNSRDAQQQSMWLITSGRRRRYLKRLNISYYKQNVTTQRTI
jgi:hypothetical protein